MYSASTLRLPSTGSNEIQQLRRNKSLGRVSRPESLKPWSSKCRSMRSSHGAIQPPPDSRNPTRNFGCRSHTPPQHAHRSEHHFHRVRDNVLRAAALEAVDADRRHAAVAALVNADREVEILGGAP